MIEFKGELSQNCKKFLLKKQINAQFKASLITTIVFGIIILLIAIPNRLNVLIFLIPLVIFAFLSLIPPSKKSQKSFIPIRIYVDLEDGAIVHECEKMQRSHPIESVKSIIDYGEWYYFEFEFGNRDLYYICQKSLITNGLLEDFEEIFMDKITKK